MKKRITILVIASMVFAVLLGGCQTATPTNAGPTPTTAPTEISVYMTQTGVPDLDINTTKLPVFAAIEQKFNVKLTISAFDSSAYGTVLLPLIASGSNLPDTWVMGGADLVQMGIDGTIIDLNQLMTDNAPDTMALLNQYPLAKYSITAPDGKVWGFPNRIAPYDDSFQGLDIGYRLDWAQNLVTKGVLTTANPVTLDDWYKMLVAFRDNDPTGKGTKVIPYAAQAPIYLWDWSLPFAMSPWSGWFSSWNGKVTFDWSDPNSQAKAYVTMLNKWYSEKLIDQDLLVDHGAAIDAGTLSGTVGAELTWTGSFAGFTATMNKNGDTSAVWMVALPPKGTGTGLMGQSYENYSYVNGERWMISKTAKDPATIIKIFNYCLADPQGQILNNFGVEGQSYTMVNGVPTFTTDILKNNKYNDAGLAIAALGVGKFPQFVRLDSETQTYALSYSQALIDRMAEIKPLVRVMFPGVTATAAESTTLTKMTDIGTTVDEYFAKAIVGTANLTTDWDAFVAKINAAGIADVLAAKQAQYDRFYQVKS